MVEALPWLIFAATLLLASIKSSAASRMAKPGCTDTCGNLTIPYPFGIGEGCFREGFEVSCENNTVYRHNSSSSMKIYDIGLLGGQARVNTFIASNCFNDTGGWASLGTGEFLTVSTKANKLTAVGCNTLAFLGGFSKHSVGAGCFSMCVDKQSVDDSGQCSGMGCCQTSIAPNLVSFNVTLDDRFNNSEVSGFNPCSYAFVAEQDWFRFEASYLEGFTEKFKDGVPTILDWVVGTGYCDEAVRNVSTYACINKNSRCINSPNATGYLCTCSGGFAGNPYLEAGCEDIDECSFPDQYPCHGICRNLNGDYSCSCKSGTQSIDPKRESCNPIAASERAKLIKMFTGIGVAIGAGVGLILLVLTAFIISNKLKHRRAQLLKQKFFQQNRGQLLQQLVSQSASIGERMIITLEDLEKATHNFDEDLVVGGGGHGTVYKGILSNQHIVAIKKPKKVIQKEIDEFINEVAILSQINHRNVVKLYGCCLETEVPMLVYEFISNGTLYEHLHVEGPRSLSSGNRLRISIEAAKSLAYLHSAASIPIIHRDVKSANILLDDTLTAKVADFGASRCIPIEKSGVTTMAQGTRGYWDPMIFYTGRLTEKSDVYSFGVVLVELLTRKKPFSYLSLDDEGLVVHFVTLFAEGKLLDILDPQVMEEGGEEVEEVATIAVACLKLKGEDRPTMRQVELTLEGLLPTMRQVGNNDNAIDVQSTNKVKRSGEGSTRRYSMEREFILSARYPR